MVTVVVIESICFFWYKLYKNIILLGLMTEVLRSQLISNIENLAKSRALSLRCPKVTFVRVNMCMFCNKTFPEEEINCFCSFLCVGPPGMILYCKDHILDAKLSMILDFVNLLSYPMDRSNQMYKTNHGDAQVWGIRLSKSEYPGKPVIQFYSPSEAVHFCRTYSQFLEMNTKEDLRKLLDVKIPDDYPQELIDRFTSF